MIVVQRIDVVQSQSHATDVHIVVVVVVVVVMMMMMFGSSIDEDLDERSSLPEKLLIVGYKQQEEE